MNTLFAPASLSPEDHAGPAAVSSTPTRVVVRDLVLAAEVGVYAHERGRRQRIRVGLDVETAPCDPPLTGGEAVEAVHAVLSTGHITLVETLAERVAARCLADPRAVSVRVRVEKLDVFPDAAAVGVEFERRRG